MWPVTLNFSFLWIPPPQKKNLRWAPKFAKTTGYSSPTSFEVLFGCLGNNMFGSGSEVLENEHEGGFDDFIEEVEYSHSHMHSH